MSELRDRMERGLRRLQERVDDPALRGTERVRLEGKLEGVKLALSYLADEERSPRAGVTPEDLERALEPVMGMYRAQMRADVWHEVWTEAAKANREAVDQRDGSAPGGTTTWIRLDAEATCWGKLLYMAANRKKAGLRAAEEMRKLARLPE